jgi:hypothetical protein
MEEIIIRIEKDHVMLHIPGDIRCSYPITMGEDNDAMVDAIAKDLKKALRGQRLSTLG